MKRFLLAPILTILIFSVASCQSSSSDSEKLRSAYKELKLDMTSQQVIEIVAKRYPNPPIVQAGKTESGKDGQMLIWLSEIGDKQNSEQTGVMVILEDNKLIAARFVKQITEMEEFFRQ